MQRRLALHATLAALGTAGIVGPAWAQSYPERPVKFIVAYAAGGPNDVYCRLLATALSEQLKQTFLVENKPGAGGLIGSAALAQSMADGYTLGFGAIPLISEIFHKSPPYNAVRDFEVVGGLYTTPYYFVVNASLPVKTLKEFVDYAKLHPGTLNYAAGTSSGSMAGEMFKALSGTDIVQVKYKGNAPALQALLSNEVQAYFDQYTTIKPLVDAGKLRLLAVTSDKRVPQVPEVPTFAEVGYPKMTVQFSSTVFMRAGAPRAAVQRLHDALRQVAATPAVVERLKLDGVQPYAPTLAELQAQLKADMTFWAEAARVANFVPE